MFYISIGYIIIYLENLDYQYLPEYQDHLEWNNKSVKWKYDHQSMYYDNSTVTYLLVLLVQLFQVFLCNPKVSQKNIAFSISFDIIIVLISSEYIYWPSSCIAYPSWPAWRSLQSCCELRQLIYKLKEFHFGSYKARLIFHNVYIFVIFYPCKNSNIPRKTAAQISLRSSSEYSRP